MNSPRLSIININQMQKTNTGSVAKRLMVSKTLGAVIGLIAFLMLPSIWVDAPMYLRVGILLWYITFGGMVGLMGLINQHPVWPSIKLPAWFRGPFIGGWLNFVLVFFAYNEMETMLINADMMGMMSPFWFVLFGAIFGLIIDLAATKVGGDGKEIL